MGKARRAAGPVISRMALRIADPCNGLQKSPCHARRHGDIARRTFLFNESAERRELRRANASSRRKRPVMIGLQVRSPADRLTPPPACERVVHSENIMTESTPEFSTSETISSTRPAAGYIGGKRNLASRICAIIETIPHAAYGEPFVGMGGVFLRRRSVPRVEAINDWSMDVANFFRICQRHYVAFMDMLRFQLTTRAGFELLMKVDPSTLTDLERAARFLYLQRAAFGGKVAGRSFGVDRHGPARFDVTKLGPILEAIHERLASVVIERLRWNDFMTRWDRSGMLFYCDPPYYGSEGDYGLDDCGNPLFDRGQFERMATTMGAIRASVLVSLNDHPEVRSIFAGYELIEVETTYTLGRTANGKRVGELLILKRE